MANIKSFPNNQDVYIGAEDVMKWLHGRTSGVFAADGNASVSALADSTMAVTVSDGLGWMANAGKDGVAWWIDNEAVNGAKLQLSIDPADGVLNRIDRIIVEWKTTNYVDYPEVKVLKGANSSKATAPALTNNSTVRQISLAKINVAAGTTAINASMITDERLDNSVCGLVTESVGIDTETMQRQFEEFLTAIQEELYNLNAGTECLLKSGGVPIPTREDQAANKQYVDELGEESIEYPGCYYRIVEGETEWLNPPMMPGVEYRTTERAEGKIVYAKRIVHTPSSQVGSSTSGASYSIPHGVSNFGNVVRTTGYFGDNYISPHFNSVGGYVVIQRVYSGGIILMTYKNTTSSKFVIDIYYTKA